MFAPGRVLQISSTQVRSQVAQGAPISHLVPVAVQQVIAREGLYRQSFQKEETAL